MDKQIIPVVFATDETYVPYCGVAISSLIMNIVDTDKRKYEISVLYDELSARGIYRLEHLSTDHVSVRCVCIHSYIERLEIEEYNHLTMATVYRLAIPQIFEKYGKVIYLDSDIIVNADIAELYDIDISDNILGAVRGYFKKGKDHFLYNHITERLEIDENQFFNAGILVINTKRFKENQIAEKCFSLLEQRKDLYYMDQCALNITCEGSVYFLPRRWNYEWLFLFSSNNPSIDNELKTMELYKNPAIIHYDGVEKPWDYPEQLLADYFWSYARGTVFYEEILYVSQLRRTRELLELFGAVGKYRDIAVYGAGNAGKRYVSKIRSLNLCKIVIWVDRKYAEKQGYELPVEDVEKLFITKFDYVFIAIENEAVSNEVKEVLMKRGIEKEKIIQIR